jgi:hypothetical protein
MEIYFVDRGEDFVKELERTGAPTRIIEQARKRLKGKYVVARNREFNAPLLISVHASKKLAEKALKKYKKLDRRHLKHWTKERPYQSAEITSFQE